MIGNWRKPLLSVTVVTDCDGEGTLFGDMENTLTVP